MKARRRLCSAAAGLSLQVLAVASAAVASPASEVAAGGLPRAEIVKPLGVTPELLEGQDDEPVRVAIILDDQPVLEETTKAEFEASLSGYTRGDLQQAARRSPEGISGLEAGAARDAERRRTAVVAALEDEVAQIDELRRRSSAPSSATVGTSRKVNSPPPGRSRWLPRGSSALTSTSLPPVATCRRSSAHRSPSPSSTPRRRRSARARCGHSTTAAVTPTGPPAERRTCGRTSRSGWRRFARPVATQPSRDLDHNGAARVVRTALQPTGSSRRAMRLIAASLPGSQHFARRRCRRLQRSRSGRGSQSELRLRADLRRQR